MATVSDIKAAILKVAGNPEAGPIKALAQQMAEAVAALDKPEAKAAKPVKEVRVVEPDEQRS